MYVVNQETFGNKIKYLQSSFFTIHISDVCRKVSIVWDILLAMVALDIISIPFYFLKHVLPRIKGL
jgi:hypothetical protein